MTPDDVLRCALAAGFVLTMSACAGPSPGGPGHPAPGGLMVHAPGGPRGPGGPGPSNDRSLDGTGNGLEVRTWVVEDHRDRLAAVMAAHRDAWTIDQSRSARLERNGLRLVRLPLDQLPLLRDELGGTLFDVTGWHGQVTDWRVLVERPLDSSARALAVDGRVRALDHDATALFVRGWTVLREDGPCVELHVVPQLRSARRQAHVLPELSGDRWTGDNLDAGAIQAQLERGWAYVLTGEAPGVPWRAEAASPDAAPADARPDQPTTNAPRGRGGAIHDQRPPRRSVERSWPAGPDAAPPPTVGELLFIQRASPPTRTLLIFIAHVPSTLIPAPEPAMMAPDLVAPLGGGEP